MKKYRVLFFLLIVLAGMMVLLSCRTEPQKDTDQESISKDGLVFEESYHSRDGFLDRSFACLTAEYGGAQYCVDQLIQEETAKSIVESIDRFVSQVRDYLKQDSKRWQTILIVHDKDKAIAYTNEQGDTAVISDLAVSEGICDPVLLRVFFSEKITNWMSYGLRGLLSEAANDENTLFSEAVEWNEIGPACYPGLNSIDEIKDTGDIAASLMQEILREHGKEVLVDFILNMNRGERCGLLRELFRKNGIKYAPDERLIFADFTANEKYDVIVNLPEYSIQIKTNHEDAYDIKNASDIAVFIAYVDRTYKKIAENVRKDFSGSGMALDESYYTIEINEEDGLHAEGAGQTFPEERRISLKQKPHLSLPHEFVHLLTGTFATGWLAEGYAEYVAYSVCAESYNSDWARGDTAYASDMRYVSAQEAIEERSSLEGFKRKAADYWVARGYSLTEGSVLNFREYCDGIAYGLLDEYGKEAVCFNEESASLNYDAIVSFICFVSDECGTDAVARMLAEDKAQGRITSFDIDKMQGEWLRYLKPE